MNTTWSANKIQQQISQDTLSCEALLALLTEEREALKSRNMDELERILTEKTRHLQELEQSAEQRNTMAGTLKNQHDQHEEPDSWKKMLAELNNDGLSTSWEKLKELLKLCKLENEINGKLLARNHQIYARMLELVCGKVSAPTLYDSRGSSSASGSSNIVGEA